MTHPRSYGKSAEEPRPLSPRPVLCPWLTLDLLCGGGGPPVKPLSGRLGRCLGASSSRGSRCSQPVGTMLDSQGPEQKRLSEESRLAWISETAAGKAGWISRQLPGPPLMSGLGMLSGEAGWVKGEAESCNSSH